MTQRFLDSWLKAMTPPPLNAVVYMVANEDNDERKSRTRTRRIREKNKPKTNNKSGR